MLCVECKSENNVRQSNTYTPTMSHLGNSYFYRQSKERVTTMWLAQESQQWFLYLLSTHLLLFIFQPEWCVNLPNTRVLFIEIETQPPNPHVLETLNSHEFCEIPQELEYFSMISYFEFHFDFRISYDLQGPCNFLHSIAHSSLLVI